MKKGSKLLKCEGCGKPIAWRIPKGTIGGLFLEVEEKDICHWQIVKVGKNNYQYLCDECKEKVG